MEITKYRTEISEDFRTLLVKEQTFDYPINEYKEPEMVTQMLNDLFHLNVQGEEFLYMIAFNSKNKVLGVFEVSHGVVNCTYCGPREIFLRALLCGASTIILAHNHPSSDITPSREDCLAFARIRNAAKIIGINVIDNIIVGNGYYSFSKENMLTVFENSNLINEN